MTDQTQTALDRIAESVVLLDLLDGGTAEGTTNGAYVSTVCRLVVDLLGHARAAIDAAREAKNAAWENEFWSANESKAKQLAASEMSDAELWQNTCDRRWEYATRHVYYIAMERRGYRMPDLLPVEGDPMPERLATAPDLPPAA